MVKLLWIIDPQNMTLIAPVSQLASTQSNIQGGLAQEQHI